MHHCRYLVPQFITCYYTMALNMFKCQFNFKDANTVLIK